MDKKTDKSKLVFYYTPTLFTHGDVTKSIPFQPLVATGFWRISNNKSNTSTLAIEAVLVRNDGVVITRFVDELDITCFKEYETQVFINGVNTRVESAV